MARISCRRVQPAALSHRSRGQSLTVEFITFGRRCRCICSNKLGFYSISQNVSPHFIAGRDPRLWHQSARMSSNKQQLRIKTLHRMANTIYVPRCRRLCTLTLLAWSSQQLAVG
ncbi:hypothetical protein ABBQ38_007842 [Trebouxia sp. C0009 RCD-2024]